MLPRAAGSLAAGPAAWCLHGDIDDPLLDVEDGDKSFLVELRKLAEQRSCDATSTPLAQEVMSGKIGRPDN
jgi:hypothetical protein